MSLNIEFTRKSHLSTSSNKSKDKPTELHKIDEELCNLLGVEPDPYHYIELWLDMIGRQACIEGYELGTKALRDVVLSWDSPKLLIIHDYLAEHYTSYAWYGGRKYE